ncbi:hypothetical protein L2E82_32078 [Cichorium intybus]|uniref:Uncharacterized protein n=1 Tax=Cichorium intybus TaxID=13427 RepID=A0ACB9BGL1_CICIN|nr:hypothetical protein L2E82_32078 [Cichorium intybus]
MIGIRTSTQPSIFLEVAFPRNTVHIVDRGLDSLMVGCGKKGQLPDFKTINDSQEYVLEFNDKGAYFCTFNWRNKHIKFPVFNRTISKLCIGGIIKDCFWRATKYEFQFLEETWETMYTCHLHHPLLEKGSWVSPDWLTSLTRSISNTQSDDSNIPIAMRNRKTRAKKFRNVLRNYGTKYAKGLVAEVSEFLFGSGFAIAEGSLWTARRTAVVPSLHKKYLSVIVDRVFCKCSQRFVEKLKPYALNDTAVNMDPVIESVYTALKEAEARSTDFLSYWKIQPIIINHVAHLHDRILTRHTIAATGNKLPRDQEPTHEMTNLPFMKFVNTNRFYPSKKKDESLGATTLNIPDTVGYNWPREFRQLIADIKANTPGIENLIISTDCQNDFGLSTANTLEASFHKHSFSFQISIHMLTYLNSRGLIMVEKYSGLMLQPHKPIVGVNSFAHENGIHPPKESSPTYLDLLNKYEYKRLMERRYCVGRRSWKDAGFHVATTIATPAAYAPLPFVVSSLGWPLGTVFDLFELFLKYLVVVNLDWIYADKVFDVFINAMDPKTKKILQLLRLRQIFNGVFLKVNKATLNMLHMMEPYVTYGYPNLKSVKELIYKRGYGKLNKQRIPLTDNSIVEQVY